MRLIHRMKVLMALVQELGGSISASDLHAYLFLYCHAYIEHNHYYDFIPQATGPHSLQAEADKQVLVNKNCLKASDNWMATEGIERFAVALDFFEKLAIQQLKNRWLDTPSEALHLYVHEQYPDYVTHQKTASAAEEQVFYTIGYEGKTPEAYLNTLLEHHVALLCDVRRNAFSQKYGFSKEELKTALEKVGIGYRHIPELGIVSEKRRNLSEHQDYRTLFDAYEQETLAQQQDKLDLLAQLTTQHSRIAITCFEANVQHCHRSRVARALQHRPDFCYPITHL